MLGGPTSEEVHVSRARAHVKKLAYKAIHGGRPTKKINSKKTRSSDVFPRISGILMVCVRIFLVAVAKILNKMLKVV